MKNTENVISMHQTQNQSEDQNSWDFNELTEVFAANEFVTTFKDELAYCPQRGQWLQYNQDCGGWEVDEARSVIQKAIEVTKNLLSDAGVLLVQASKVRNRLDRETAYKNAVALSKFAMNTQTKKKLDSMVALASTFPEMVVSTRSSQRRELFALFISNSSAFTL